MEQIKFPMEQMEHWNFWFFLEIKLIFLFKIGFTKICSKIPIFNKKFHKKFYERMPKFRALYDVIVLWNL